MRRGALAVISILVAALITACGLVDVAKPILEGEHDLRKMVEYNDTEGKISGSFFLVFGDLQGNTQNKSRMQFAWRMNDGTWAISSLEMERFRMGFNESATTPRIRFAWAPYNQARDTAEMEARNNTGPTLQRLMDRNVAYAILTIRERVWPVKIQLPLNK